MGHLLDRNLAEVEARCTIDPDGELAWRFLREWIDVSLDMGLDSDFRDNVKQQIIGFFPQERLF